MRSIQRFVVVIGVSMLALGCAAMRAAEERRRAEIETARSADYDVDRNKVTEAVLSSLLQLDYTIDRQIPTSGYIETNFVERPLLGSMHRVRIAAQVSEQRPHSVAIQAQVLSSEKSAPATFENEIYLLVHQKLTQPRR
jgi:hypothetical protein